jgi:hypothetical protein
MSIPEKIFLSAVILLVTLYAAAFILALSALVMFINDPRVILP